jgi:hypothetical protein
MVLASGEVVTCSETESQELFWAVRGAGQNFGAAVEFVYRAHEQAECYAGLAMFPAEEEVLRKVVEVTNRLYTPTEKARGEYASSVLGGKGAGGLGFARPPPAGGRVIILAPVFYHGTEEAAKEAYKELFALGPMINTCAMVPYTMANQMLNPPPMPAMRSSMKGASYTWPLRPEFAWETLKSFEEFTDRVPDARGSLLLYEANDAAKAVQSASNTDMGFCNRGWQANACIAPIWDGQGNDQVSRQWARDAAELFKEELKRGGQVGGVGTKGANGAVMIYGNYDRESSFA